MLAHEGGRGQSFVYELVYDGQGRDGARFLPGLLDVEALGAGKLEGILANPEGVNRDLEGSRSPQCARLSTQVGAVVTFPAEDPNKPKPQQPNISCPEGQHPNKSGGCS